VKPESLLNFELGEGWRDKSLQILANVYFMNFRDEIIENGQLDRFGEPITGNADRTLHYGLELSASYSPLPQIEISGNALASRARLMRYTVWVVDSSTQTSRPVDLSGNRIAGFPEYLANAQLSWRNYGCSVLLTWKFVGDQYTDNFQNANNKVDPYTVLNAMFGYKMKSVLGFRGIEFRLAVNNILNKLYAQSGDGDQFFVAADRNYYFEMAVDL
jgi:iron complex outermembrane receptor protein